MISYGNEPGTANGRISTFDDTLRGPDDTIAVAMSGGVDSSTAAALLKQRGYNVIGLTMKLWADSGPGSESENLCCPLSATEDARRVAGVLGIPHYVINLEDEFRELVVQDFTEQYAAGRTPNPCIVCNSLVKFGLLLRRAIELGANRLATGHYARLKFNSESGRYELLRGLDPRKDQSYALYRLTQDQLSHLVFPLGTFTKAEVRSVAERLRLPVARRSESQEICFIPDKDYRGFLKRRRGRTAYLDESRARASSSTRERVIVSTSGEVLGRHSGIEGFTIGQRKGLGIASDHRLYVIDIDPEHDTVIVGEEHELYSAELTASECNWISMERPHDGLRADAKIRYSFEPVPVTIRVVRPDAESIRVEFDEPVRAVTPGQAVVFYDGEVVLGGGTIERSARSRGGSRHREGDT